MAARLAVQSANPEAIILTEGPLLEGLFEYTDGSLDWGIHSLVERWLWDAQGKTDTVTAGYSLDDWHQILAIGGKLGCPPHFLEAPPNSSAKGVLDVYLKRDLPDDPNSLRHLAYEAFWNLHQWRNAGLILGLPMPGLDDLCPRIGMQIHDPIAEVVKNHGTFIGTLEALRPRAAAIDAAFAGRSAPAPTAYIKTLLAARHSLARLIDHGSSVVRVSPLERPTAASVPAHAAAWRFTSENGMALTAVNVADEPCHVGFPSTTRTWRDGVHGDVFTARGGTLIVSVPAHGIRLLSPT